jgi:hypothetical protein
MKHSEYIVVKGEPFCLSRGIEKLKNGDVKKKKIKTVEYVKERKFKLVEVDVFDPTIHHNFAYKYLGKFWADIVTGTLYHPETGECLTSTQIQLIVE